MKPFLFSLFMTILASGGAFAQELLTFSGYHTQLYGYTDSRYTGTDKGDYLKTLAVYGGAEYIQRGLALDEDFAKHVVLGAASTVTVQNAFDPKSLYAVSGNGYSIASQTVPASTSDAVGKTQVTLSGFGGYSDEWWGLEGGLTFVLKIVDEKTRQKVDATGTVYDSAGRGWVPDGTPSVLPNVQLRLGSQSFPHFVVSVYRGQYDPTYGYVQARVVVPFAGGSNLQVGGSFLQTASIFVEPTFRLGFVDLGVRAGTILNYNDAAFTRVGIFEGLFFAGSAVWHW